MATGGRLRDSDVPDIYSCAVCWEHLLDRNPRFLSCYHSFCQQCLQELTNDGQVSCPTCRAVTAVPNNDITKLTMNFQLVQMMEREKELKEQTQTHFSCQNCHFCGKENAVCKCGDCNQFLCEGCEIKHKKMKMFKNHAILKLCEKHFDGISHICMTCLQAVCLKCFVLEHAEHEVIEYQDGVGQLKSNLEETKKKLKERRNVFEKCENKADSMKTNANKERMKLQTRRYALVKEIEQIDHKLLCVGKAEKRYNEDFKMYKELKEKYDVSYRNVGELLQLPNDEIVSNFCEQNTLVEKLLHKTEKFNIKFKINLNEKLKWLQKPVLRNNFCNLGRFQINLPTSIKAVEPDLLVYSDYSEDRLISFVVFDDKGDVKRCFEGQKEHGDVKCVDVYKNKLFLAQEKEILCFSNFNTTQEKCLAFLPKMKSLSHMAAVSENILICSDYEGKVYQCNTEDDSTEMVLQELRNTTNISVGHTPQGTRYILTFKLPGPFSNHGSLKIYNEFWQLLTTITQGITYPQDTVPCPGGFLLADYNSNKITLYIYTGDKVRTVLTKDDGLDGPRSLLLKPPFLWVGQKPVYSSNGRIACFKVL